VLIFAGEIIDFSGGCKLFNFLRLIASKDGHTFVVVLTLYRKTSLNTDQLPLISKSQLALRNGQDKDQVWVAYNGLVYDVTASRLWRSGKHYEHWAGQDLTDELKDAPHTEKVFDKFQVIGRLKN
jgi:predicted heme/steroid binding protein